MDSTTKIESCPDHGTQTTEEKPHYVAEHVDWGKLKELEREDLRVLYKTVMEALEGKVVTAHSGVTVEISTSARTDYRIEIRAYFIEGAQAIFEALKRKGWTPRLLDVNAIGKLQFKMTVWV